MPVYCVVELRVMYVMRLRVTLMVKVLFSNCFYFADILILKFNLNIFTDLEVAQPHFSGSIDGLSSYVAYPIPLPMEYSVELNFKIIPTTMSQISLLAFLGQTGYHDEKSDHLAVSFIQGTFLYTQ